MADVEKTVDLAVLFEKIEEDAKDPEVVYESDAGFIVYPYKVEGIYEHGGGNSERLLTGKDIERKFVEPGVLELQCNERALIGTRLLIDARDAEFQVRTLGSLAWEQGIIVLNSPGTMEPDVHTELFIMIMNTSRQTQRVRLDKPIAKVVPSIKPVVKLKKRVVDGTKRPKSVLLSKEKRPERRDRNLKPEINL